MNAKTQKLLYSLLAFVIVAGILLAVYFFANNNAQTVADGTPLVDYDASKHTPGENLVFGLQTAGVGMGIVFAVLIILWAAIALVSKIVGGESAPKQTAAPAPAQAAAPVATNDETELVAVCTAAIAAARGESDCAFNIISITEIQ